MTRLGELDPEVLPPHYRHNSASAWIFFKADQPGFNFGVKFSYGEELRVVRYIDDGDKASTRRLFEGLHTKKKEIEQRIGAGSSAKLMIRGQ